MSRLLDLLRGKSPTPKPQYDTRTEMVYSYELNLLRSFIAHKEKRPEIARKLKAFNAWKLDRGL